MQRILFFTIILVVLTSCSQYQKALNKDDVALKYKVADSLYSIGKYAKAVRLFEQMAPSYRGKPQAEKMFYMFAMSTYKLKQYHTSAVLFDRFVLGYPNSIKLEEAKFMSGKSYFEISPKYSKDQVDTYKAIDKLQAFLNAYPDSEYAKEANEIIVVLNQKIEKKYFEIAKQYNTIAEYTNDYKAAIVALDNFLINYPGTIYTEDALYYKFDSMYHIALKSIPSLKKDRLIQAKNAYEQLIKHNGESKYRTQADRMVKDVENELLKS
ncbi:MAG: outer membrane protein assembly factor BamD [Bacteroidota bacterium]|nr:outer membrane protein assembly factor BamD [Bacteroidota bacterium]